MDGMTDSPRVVAGQATDLGSIYVRVTTFTDGGRYLTLRNRDCWAMDVMLSLSRPDIMALRDALDASLALDAPAQADAMLRACAAATGESDHG